MEKKEYKAPKLHSYGSIDQFTFASPTGNDNGEEFNYQFHFPYHRRRTLRHWSGESLTSLANS